LTERSLRYAEWAQLVGKKQTVSNFHFNVHETTSKIEPQNNDRRGSSAYDSTRLMIIKPTYAYRNRTMTERDLYREMMIASDKWEDFRTQTVGDRDEDMIGSLHVEVLACHGLVRAHLIPSLSDMSNDLPHTWFTSTVVFFQPSQSWTNFRAQTLSATLFVDRLRLHPMSSMVFLTQSGQGNPAEHAFSPSSMPIRSYTLVSLMMMVPGIRMISPVVW
jgi:hypothetical protein